MATFVWPPEVQWPPPAHILLNYDVVDPDGVMLSPMRATEEEAKRMTKVVIVGEVYTSPSEGPPPPGIWPGPRPDQGLPGQGSGQPPSGSPPGMWPGGPVDPGYGRPGGGGPVDPGYGQGGGHPSHPIAGSPPGMWPGGPTDPSWGVGGSGNRPGQGPIEPPPGGTPVPPEEIPTPPDPPEEYADQVIVQIYVPEKGWTTTAYETGQRPDQGPEHPDQSPPQEQPQPNPQRQRR